MMLKGAWRAATIALFATAVTAGAPGLAEAQDLACDRDEQEVRALEFRGNLAVSDADLGLRVITTPSAILRRRLHIPIGEKRCVDASELSRDARRLRSYYHDRGFRSAKVETLVERVDKNAVRVIFNIDEGQPLVLQSYDVTGLDGVPDSAAIMNRRRLRVGEPFDVGLFQADLDSIQRRLRNGGYYRANVVPAHDTNNDSLVAHVAIAVLPGTRARFGESVLNITPADHRIQQVGDETVRRVMGIATGDQYSDRAIIEAQRVLFQLGAYRHIEVAPLADSLQLQGDTLVVLGVRLTEDYMKRLDTEYGWATLDCGRVRMQYTDVNFAKTARRFELTAHASKIGFGEPLAAQSTKEMCTFGGRSPLAADSVSSSNLNYYGGFSIRQPRLLGTLWVPTLSLYSERRGEYKAYLRTTNLGGDISATRDIASRTQLRLGYSLEYGKTKAPEAVLCAIFSRCDAASREQIQDIATLGVASVAVVRHRTDNLISPTRGSILRTEARSSASPLLGTSQFLFFNKISGDAAFYRPLGWRNVLLLRMRAGAVVGRRLSDAQPFVPPQERLYAGGATSVRGFQPNELGGVVYIARQDEGSVQRDTITPPFRYTLADSARHDRVVPTGGNSLLVMNMEYRIRDPFLFPDLVQYSLFLDGGDVWTGGSPQIRWTPGFGIRALTPVGPMQINLGFNPYRRPAGPIYFEDPLLRGSPVSPLYCVSPGNSIDLGKVDDVWTPQQSGCEHTYTPPERKRFYQKLTLTFSIGPEF